MSSCQTISPGCGSRVGRGVSRQRLEDGKTGALRVGEDAKAPCLRDIGGGPLDFAAEFLGSGHGCIDVVGAMKLVQ